MQFDPLTYDRLIRIHQLKLDVFNAMTGFEATEVDALKTLAGVVTTLEFMEQRLSGFSEDKRLHLFWQLPYCSCSKEENERRWKLLISDYFCYPGPVYDPACPHHGSEHVQAEPTGA